MKGITKLLESYKGWAFLVTMVALVVLAGLDKIAGEKVIEVVEWALPILLGARALEEGAKSVAASRMKD